jgi:hypothetical protein
MVASKVLVAKRALVKILLALAVAYSVILKVNRDAADAVVKMPHHCYDSFWFLHAVDTMKYF